MNELSKPRTRSSYVSNKGISTPRASEDDDVIYLYSVQNQNTVVEVIDIDITPDVTNVEENGLVTRSFTRSQAANAKTPAKKITPSALPPKKPQMKRKRVADIPQCVKCLCLYEEAKKQGGLHCARCGHLYCLDCSKTLTEKKCIECKKTISALVKIFV